MTGVKRLKLNSKIRWSKATALLTVAVALLIGMGAAPAMANSPLTTTSSCFTGGCHGYADFAAWHNYHRTTMAIACSTCHTTAPAMKSTADACDGCHSGEVAKHSTRSAGCSTCHHDPVATFTLTYTAGSNGSIVGSSTQVVNSGSAGTAVTATPTSGYHFVSWSDGVATAARTDTNVTANVTASATFAANPVGKISTSLTIRTTRTSAYIGQTFILSGLARPTPGMIGQNMEVYVKKPGKSYWTYTSRRTIYVGPSGTAEWWFRYYLDPNKVASGLVRRGTYLFKAVYNGDATYAASQSTIISVLVR